MALQRAQDTGNSAKFQFSNSGDTLKGYYLKTTDEVINGSPAKKHWFSTSTGIVTVLGQANMYKQLVDNETKGFYVEVTFTGNVIKLKGSKTMKCYSVDFDLQSPYTGEIPSDSNEPAYDDFGDETSVDAEDSVVEAPAPVRAVAPRTPAQAPDAARQAKVQALLNANRK